MSEWQRLIRDIPDFPQPGIGCKANTPLLAHDDGFAEALDAMAAPGRGSAESRESGTGGRQDVMSRAHAAPPWGASERTLRALRKNSPPEA